ncbi:hypothetical protein SAY87_021232 [Trapa incisa]|uniref:Uncharacterized protein n=1 Tax=Trapa incisa TaxID=236973 RepID=A0AAN7PQY2_9MYRT|nr:hypothetical protein SAY87_021229 [Trapa incisa]KAK4752434.1 hypothetical protein SAY87_021232 [Trapa incisa]
MAVFMGVSLSQSESPETRSHCKVDIEDDTDRSLLVYEVISLACYLLSSLVAKALSIELSTYLFRDVGKFIRFGSMFTRDSMLMPPWIRLGRMTCCHDPMRAAGGLIAIFAMAFFIYIPFTMHAIYLSMTFFRK